LRGLLGSAAGGAGAAADAGPLRVIQVGVGNSIYMVPIEQVLCFEAADKYVRVITATREHLIRTSLRELLPRLDPGRFWQIHRGTVVRAEAILSAERDESGRVTLKLQGRPEKLVVSRLYAHRFKAM
jgi:DNA-binding LytR/AlgR family response regulator